VKFPRLPNFKLELKRLYHSGFARNLGVGACMRGEPQRVTTGHEAYHVMEQL
jgi:hypothetical protein